GQAREQIVPPTCAVEGEAIDPTSTTTPQGVSPDDREIQLIGDVARFPISTVTERYARLSWNPKTGNAIKERCLGRGLLAFAILPVHQGRVKLLTLTDAGLKYAREHNIAVVAMGRGGLEHEFWRHRLAERCAARGYTVTREHHLGQGHRVDLLAVKGTRRILI